jgi:hypothetical protein
LIDETRDTLAQDKVRLEGSRRRCSVTASALSLEREDDRSPAPLKIKISRFTDAPTNKKTKQNKREALGMLPFSTLPFNTRIMVRDIAPSRSFRLASTRSLGKNDRRKS